MFLKVVLVGNTAVGKTNIIFRYTRDEFIPNSFFTIGVEYFTKNITRNE